MTKVQMKLTVLFVSFLLLFGCSKISKDSDDKQSASDIASRTNYVFDLEWFSRNMSINDDSLKLNVHKFGEMELDDGRAIIYFDTLCGRPTRTIHIFGKGMQVSKMKSCEFDSSIASNDLAKFISRNLSSTFGSPTKHNKGINYWDVGELVYFCSDSLDKIPTVGAMREDGPLPNLIPDPH